MQAHIYLQTFVLNHTARETCLLEVEGVELSGETWGKEGSMWTLVTGEETEEPSLTSGGHRKLWPVFEHQRDVDNGVFRTRERRGRGGGGGICWKMPEGRENT